MRGGDLFGGRGPGEAVGFAETEADGEGGEASPTLGDLVARGDRLRLRFFPFRFFGGEGSGGLQIRKSAIV